MCGLFTKPVFVVLAITYLATRGRLKPWQASSIGTRKRGSNEEAQLKDDLHEVDLEDEDDQKTTGEGQDHDEEVSSSGFSHGRDVEDGMKVAV